MRKAGKITLAMVTALTLVNCGTVVTPLQDTSSTSLVARHPSPLQDTSSASLLTAHSSPVKEDFSALAKKYNFAELETEYKSFKTKALSDAYVIRMFNKFLIVSPNALQVIRQIEFSRYLSNKGDTTYEASLESMFVNKPALYNALTTLPDVQSKITQESGTFGFYILEISPYDTVPVALTPDDITTSSFTAKWTPITNASSYILKLNGTEITGIIGTSYPVSGLANGSLHTYSVKPVINGMTGTESNQITVKTILPAPVAAAASGIGQTGLTANWSAVTGATSYTLVFNGTEITGLTGTSYTKNDLTPGTTYPYFVKAVNVNTESVNSGTINTVTVPAAPTANAASGITTTSFTANWSAVTGATGYKLTVGGTETDVGLVTSYNKTGLSAGTTYTYSVKAYNASGTGTVSSTVSTVTLPATPVANDASGITTSEFTANWSPVAGATKYLLTINGTETDVGNVTSYSKSSLPSYTTYTYSVKAQNSSGLSPASNIITLKTNPFLTDGLAVHLPFDGNANDVSGHNHNGTLYNNPVMVNNAYKFDGTNYISVGAIPEVPADSDYAVSFWMKSDAIEDFRNALDANFIAGSTNNEGPRFEQYTNGDFGIMVGTSASNFQGIYVPNKLNINNWHHVVASKSQNVLKFYVNKEEIGSMTASSKWIPSHAFGNLVIGKGYSDVQQRAFKGLLDDIRIYSRPLSVSEIDQIYALTYPGSVYGLVAYYPFDGNANDISGYGHHGTLSNNPVLTTDKNGNSSSAYQFNGSNFINVGAIPEVPANSDFSVSFWMKSDIVENHRNPLDANFVAGNSNNEGPRFEQAHFVNSVSVSRLSVIVGTSLSNYDGIYGDNVIDATNWHHISAVKNGSTLKLYLNSQEVSSLSSSSKWIPTPGFNNLVMGKGFSDSIERWFKGKLDNVRVYNRALTVAELQSLYNFGK